MRILIAVPVLALALTACGGEKKPVAKAEPSPSYSTTPVSRWASALTGSNVVEAWANVQEACGPLLLAEDLTSPTCGATLTTLDFTAMALDREFDDVHYAGDPEPAVAELVNESRAATVRIVEATGAWSGAEPDCLMSDSETCVKLAHGVLRAMSAFPAGEWGPYL